MFTVIRAGIVCLGMLLASGQAMAAGAIAVDDEAGLMAKDVGYGIGRGPSRDLAGLDATLQCLAAGNRGCEVAVRYDSCGAYAVSATMTGAGWGDSEEEATANAMEACGAGCSLVVSDCD